MNLFALLETAIGLTFVYLMLSVLCSGINEWIAQRIGRRGRFLREGMLNMLLDRWIYLRLLNHPLVACHYRDLPGKRRQPAYLPSASVATALLDVLVNKAGQLGPSPPAGGALDFAAIRAAVEQCSRQGYTVANAVLPLLDHANGDLEAAKKAIAAWYDGAMDRVSGWYKADARWTLFLLGLATSALLNVDSIAITRSLMTSDQLRQAMVGVAVQTVETKEIAGVTLFKDGKQVELSPEDMKKLAQLGITLQTKGLPIGFSCLSPLLAPDSANGLMTAGHQCVGTLLKAMEDGAWLMKLMGWLITALAISLGGPFWFDLLNRLVDLRGAGKRPSPSPTPTAT